MAWRHLLPLVWCSQNPCQNFQGSLQGVLLAAILVQRAIILTYKLLTAIDLTILSFASYQDPCINLTTLSFVTNQDLCKDLTSLSFAPAKTPELT